MKSTSLRIAATVIAAPVQGTGIAIGWTGKQAAKVGTITALGGALLKAKADIWKTKMNTKADALAVQALTAEQEQARHNDVMAKLEEQRAAEVARHEVRLAEVARQSVVPPQTTTSVDAAPPAPAADATPGGFGSPATA